jgi:hypothetical protein
VATGSPLKNRSMRGRPSQGRAPREGSTRSSRLGGDWEDNEVEGVDVDDADGMASGVSLSLSLSLSLSFEPFSFLTMELDRFLGDADGEDLMETIDEERSRPFSFSFSGKRLTFLSSERISWLPDPSGIEEDK